MKQYIAGLILSGLNVLKSDWDNETSKLRSVFYAIWRYPIKVIATFIFAPFLMLFLIWNAFKNGDRISIHRASIGIIGLIIGSILSYVAGTFLGSLAGAIFIATHIGWIMAIGFIFGSTTSIYLTVIFQLIVFNFILTTFLGMAKTDVIIHLKKIAGGE